MVTRVRVLGQMLRDNDSIVRCAVLGTFRKLAEAGESAALAGQVPL